MTTLQYLMGLVYSIDDDKKQRVAALIDQRSLRFLAGDGGFQTAIVNVLQNSDYDMARCWIISTYKPTEMCLGMASIRKLSGLAFLDDAKTIRVQFAAEPINITGFQVANAVPDVEILPDWSSIATWYGRVENAKNNRKLTQDALKPYTTINECFNDTSRQFAKRKMPDDILKMLTTLPTDPAPTTLSQGDAIQVFMRLACAIVGESWTPLLKWTPKTKLWAERISAP